jgi:hypothetical protein
MSSYQDRVDARRERLAAKARNADTQSQSALDQGRGMFSAIPFGQPILVGHHSEGRDRRYRERADNKMRQGFALMDRAEYYRRKAAAVGTGGISSDDPEAVQKLKNKLECLEKSQSVMKAINAAIRVLSKDGNLTPSTLVLHLGDKFRLTVAQAQEALTPDFMGRIGFASCSLKNNNAEIRRVKLRIKQLENRQKVVEALVEKTGAAKEEQKFDGFSLRLDHDENRVMFGFEQKPSKAVCELMKRSGFRYAPSRSAWVRKATSNGIFTARHLVAQIQTLMG